MTDPALMFPEEIEEARADTARAQAGADRQLAWDYGQTFADATRIAGGRVLEDLIARFAGQTYTRGDHIHTAYREGQRSVIEHIARSIARTEPEKEQEQIYEHGN